MSGVVRACWTPRPCARSPRSRDWGLGARWLFALPPNHRAARPLSPWVDYPRSTPPEKTPRPDLKTPSPLPLCSLFVLKLFPLLYKSRLCSLRARARTPNPSCPVSERAMKLIFSLLLALAAASSARAAYLPGEPDDVMCFLWSMKSVSYFQGLIAVAGAGTKKKGHQREEQLLPPAHSPVPTPRKNEPPNAPQVQLLLPHPQVGQPRHEVQGGVVRRQKPR